MSTEDDKTPGRRTRAMAVRAGGRRTAATTGRSAGSRTARGVEIRPHGPPPPRSLQASRPRHAARPRPPRARRARHPRVRNAHGIQEPGAHGIQDVRNACGQEHGKDVLGAQQDCGDPEHDQPDGGDAQDDRAHDRNRSRNTGPCHGRESDGTHFDPHRADGSAEAQCHARNRRRPHHPNPWRRCPRGTGTSKPAYDGSRFAQGRHGDPAQHTHREAGSRRAQAARSQHQSRCETCFHPQDSFGAQRSRCDDAPVAKSGRPQEGGGNDA